MRGAAVLLGLGLAFLTALVLLRSRSAVLHAEAGAALAEAVAVRTGVARDDVLTLHALHGGSLDAQALETLARRFAGLRAEFTAEPLAVLALAGHDALARRLAALPGPELEPALRAHPEGIEWQRFQTLRSRFVARQR